MEKCHLTPGITIKLYAVNELDPCIYEEVECYKNVTVHVMRCQQCGHIDLSWERQEDTEEVDLDE